MQVSPAEVKKARTVIDTIRLLAADCVERAGSGHPGTPMEAAPIAYLLYSRHLRYNPANPDWCGRDRFILSCGHASALLYSLLHLYGYDLPLDELKRFRQLGSRTPGHPEFGHTPGVETTTGPLGQGVAVGVGMAMGGRFLAEQVDEELFSYRVYVLCSDGDLMEGVASEAASLAGHLQLGNLTLIYLDNRITIEGQTQLAFSEDVGARFLAYNWHVQRVEGENLPEVDAALGQAAKDPRPSLIVARTHIGFGAPGKQDSAEAHGAPLGAEELAAAKRCFGFDPRRSFEIPGAVRQQLAGCRSRGEALERQWQDTLHKKLPVNTRLATWHQLQRGDLPEGWDDDLPTFSPQDKAMATRKASGLVLNALADRLPLLLGGSADLAPSNNTSLDGQDSYTATSSGRNIHFGVREHAMGAALNGLAHTPGLIPYGGTFLIFSDYMRPPMRLAAMMDLAPIYVLTHDSIGLGEDGPTHQPVEQLPGLRSVPGLRVIRPCDANETVEAWRAAIRQRKAPTALVLSRQSLPVLPRRRAAAAEGLHRGGYVLAPEEAPLQVILLASGSEVHPGLAARNLLEERGVGCRLVSVPCQELFDEQSEAYRLEVLPPNCVARLAIEAASPYGWRRYVGHEGAVLGMTGYGASAPEEALMEHFGFTPEAIVERALALL